MLENIFKNEVKISSLHYYLTDIINSRNLILFPNFRNELRINPICNLLWTLDQKVLYLNNLFKYGNAINNNFLIIDNYKNLLLIDGYKRINTLKEFMENSFPITFNEEFIYFDKLKTETKVKDITFNFTFIKSSVFDDIRELFLGINYNFNI
jgi:archaellum biogenesis ATPase FlaH